MSNIVNEEALVSCLGECQRVQFIAGKCCDQKAQLHFSDTQHTGGASTSSAVSWVTSNTVFLRVMWAISLFLSVFDTDCPTPVQHPMSRILFVVVHVMVLFVKLYGSNEHCSRI